MGTTMAKGQKRSGREPKKPKKTASEKLKDKTPASTQGQFSAAKNPTKKP
jgi:hypothetical protein